MWNIPYTLVMNILLSKWLNCFIMTQLISQFVLENTFTRELYRTHSEGNPTHNNIHTLHLFVAVPSDGEPSSSLHVSLAVVIESVPETCSSDHAFCWRVLGTN